MWLVLDDHLLRAHLQGRLQPAVATLRQPGEPMWTTWRFQARLRRALESVGAVEGVHRREIPSDLRRDIVARIDGAALIADQVQVASDMAAIETDTGYRVPLWLEALATAKVVEGILVIAHANFAGRMIEPFSAASKRAGVRFEVVAV